LRPLPRRARKRVRRWQPPAVKPPWSWNKQPMCRAKHTQPLNSSAPVIGLRGFRIFLVPPWWPMYAIQRPDCCPTGLSVLVNALDQIGPAAEHIQPLFITAGSVTSVQGQKQTSQLIWLL
jgi:hypothetical protein